MEGPALVPAPVHLTVHAADPFLAGPGTRVVVGTDPCAVSAGVLLATRISQAMNLPVAVSHDDDGTPGAIVLRLLRGGAGVPLPPGIDPQLAREAYRLDVTSDHVHIAAPAVAGLVRGMATLLQLAALHGAAGPAALVPAVTVVDHPRFAWRGVALRAQDVPDMDGTLRLLEAMTDLKLNVLHVRGDGNGLPWPDSGSILAAAGLRHVAVVLRAPAGVRAVPEPAGFADDDAERTARADTPPVGDAPAATPTWWWDPVGPADLDGPPRRVPGVEVALGHTGPGPTAPVLRRLAFAAEVGWSAPEPGNRETFGARLASEARTRGGATTVPGLPGVPAVG